MCEVSSLYSPRASRNDSVSIVCDQSGCAAGWADLRQGQRVVLAFGVLQQDRAMRIQKPRESAPRRRDCQGVRIRPGRIEVGARFKHGDALPQHADGGAWNGVGRADFHPQRPGLDALHIHHRVGGSSRHAAQIEDRNPGFGKGFDFLRLQKVERLLILKQAALNLDVRRKIVRQVLLYPRVFGRTPDPQLFPPTTLGSAKCASPEREAGLYAAKNGSCDP